MCYSVVLQNFLQLNRPEGIYLREIRVVIINQCFFE
jgi:hypothetical protein